MQRLRAQTFSRRILSFLYSAFSPTFPPGPPRESELVHPAVWAHLAADIHHDPVLLIFSTELRLVAANLANQV